MSWQQDPGGALTYNYGNSRGLEIIPSTRLEVGLFPPSYIVHQSNVPNGFGDFSYKVKFRAFSGTEGQGDYFVGFFFGGSFPTGRERAWSRGPVTNLRRGQRPWAVGHSGHDRREPPHQWHQRSGEGAHL